MKTRIFRFVLFVVSTATLAMPGLTATSSTAVAAISHHPRVPVSKPSNGGTSSLGWASSNWSGYAVTGSGFNSVTGSWIVPKVAASKKATYSSSWVGIDGFNNSSLIQTGTEQDWYSGRAHYNAWWEILPAAETPITTIAVSPGDHFSASIGSNGGGSWTISITDTSNGESFSTVQNYSGPQTSAEWIEEAPTVGGRIATLANYSSTTFDPGTVNNLSPNLQASEGGSMIQRGIQVSTPSNPDTDVDGFNVAYGSSQPSPPSS